MKSMELFFDTPGIYKVTEVSNDKDFFIVVSNSCTAIRLDTYEVVFPSDEFEHIVFVDKVEIKY